MSNPPKPSPKSRATKPKNPPVSKPEGVTDKPKRTGKAGPTTATPARKNNLKKPKVGAPTIKAPGTENMVVTYSANNNLRVLNHNPPTYRNYIQDGSTDV